MTLPRPSTLKATTLGLIILLLGTPGFAHSQPDYYGAGPYYGFASDSYSDDYSSDYYYDYYNDDDDVLTDSELRKRIMVDWAMSPFVDGENIHISVKSGIVTLSGEVEDRSEMIDVVEFAYDAGAWRVHNKLHLREYDDGQWAEINDSELTEDIEQELALSPFVNSDHIFVRVRNGIATLYGGVENTGEIADAVENAYEAGAKRVKSKLWVDPEHS